MSPYAIVLHKLTCVLVKNTPWKSAKTVGKASGYESGGLHCVYGQKDTTVYGLEVGKTVFFEKRVLTVHSNLFPYFTGMPVSSSLYRPYSSRAGLHT